MAVEVIIKRQGRVVERKIIDPSTVAPVTISKKIRDFFAGIENKEIHKSCMEAATGTMWDRINRQDYKMNGKFPCRKSWKRSNKTAARQWAWHEGR